MTVMLAPGHFACGSLSKCVCLSPYVYVCVYHMYMSIYIYICTRTRKLDVYMHISLCVCLFVLLAGRLSVIRC